ncbi:MAG: ABC transporter permease, partial [Endomicrobia bacterium]|nr:ABC transporter permease [Endomicrobiia bacterium]
MLNLILVFLYKEWKIFTQFKFHKIINTLFYLTQIVVFYFLSKLISQEYFSFLFLGLLFSRVFSFIVSSFVETLKQEQYLQTINNLISLPYSEFIVLLSIFISKTCFMCIEFILLLLTGYFLGILFSFSQFILAFLWYIFLIFIFLWYAILSTGVSMLIRKAENLLPIINTTLDILSGVYFTPEILPFGLSLISKILP